MLSFFSATYPATVADSPRIRRSNTKFSQSSKTAILAIAQAETAMAITPIRRREFSTHHRALVLTLSRTIVVAIAAASTRAQPTMAGCRHVDANAPKRTRAVHSLGDVAYCVSRPYVFGDPAAYGSHSRRAFREVSLTSTD